MIVLLLFFTVVAVTVDVAAVGVVLMDALRGRA